MAYLHVDATMKLAVERIRRKLARLHQFNTVVKWYCAVMLIGLIFTPVPIFIVLTIVAAGCIFYIYKVTIANYFIALAVRCPSCGFALPTFVHWVCGECTNEQNNLWVFLHGHTFLEKCNNKQARHSPDAFQCPQCRQHIILADTDTGKLRFAAYEPAHPPQPPPPIPPLPNDPVPAKIIEDFH